MIQPLEAMVRSHTSYDLPTKGPPTSVVIGWYEMYLDDTSDYQANARPPTKWILCMLNTKMINTLLL